MSEPEFDWNLGEPGGISENAKQDEDTTGDNADDAGDKKSEPARDDAGRFVAATGADDSDAGGEEVQLQGDDAEDQSGQLILGKFKTQEALQEAYVNLEKMAGAKGSEVGDLRKELDAIKAQLDKPAEAQQEYAPVDNQTIEALDELAASNPLQAAQWALQYQPLLYDRVMETWFETDARGASRFETQLTLSSYQKELTDNLAPTLKPLQQETQQREFGAAWASVADKYPDIDTHADAMLEAAAGVPEIVQVLQSGDQASKARMIENLLFLARGRQADQVVDAKTAAGQAQRAQDAADKAAASVASASSNQTRGEKSNVASWKEQFLKEPSTNIWQGLETKK